MAVQVQPVTRPAEGLGTAVRRVRPATAIKAGAVLAVLVLAALTFRDLASSVGSSAGRLAGASVGWVLTAAAAAVLSMIAFGLLRRLTLRAAGGLVGLPTATLIGYEAGAVHLTTPAGGVVATGYAFRRLRGRGLPAAAITWSLAASGILSTVTLVVLGVTGLALGSAGSWSTFLPGLAGALALLGGGLWIARRPELLQRSGEGGLRLANRLLRRPADAGLLTLRATAADLAAVRPTGRVWLAGLGAATANWLLDLLCLQLCLLAVGVGVNPLLLLASYALAMAGAGASPLPGGIGIVDGVLVLGITATGAPLAAAIAAVVLYRLLSNGGVLAIGAVALAARSARRLRRPR